MEDKKSAVSFEEVLDTEVDDLWDIFFPYMADNKEVMKSVEKKEKTKPANRHMRFLTM